LAKDPHDRYERANDLANAFAEAIEVRSFGASQELLDLANKAIKEKGSKSAPAMSTLPQEKKKEAEKHISVSVGGNAERETSVIGDENQVLERKEKTEQRTLENLRKEKEALDKRNAEKKAREIEAEKARQEKIVREKLAKERAKKEAEKKAEKERISAQKAKQEAAEKARKEKEAREKKEAKEKARKARKKKVEKIILAMKALPKAQSFEKIRGAFPKRIKTNKKLLSIVALLMLTFSIGWLIASPKVLSGKIYFTSDRSGKNEIHYVDDKGDVIQMTYSPENSTSWGATPASSGKIYFTSDRSGKNEIHYVDNKGEVVQMTSPLSST